MSIRCFQTCVLLSLALFAMDGANAWAQSGFSAEESFKRMDRNGDGVLTADETERLPGFMREEFSKQGLDFSRGVRKSDFERVAPKAFEAIRSRFSQGSSRGGSSGRGDDSRRREDDRSRDDDRRREDDRREESSSSSKSEPRPTAPANRRVILKANPVTIELQKDFQAGDIDRDGQLAFYEWRQWKPTDLAEFFRLDANGDGFVTPREIQFPPGAPVAAASGTTALPSGTASASPTRVMVTTTPVAVAAPAIDPNAIDRTSVHAKRAIYFFSQLDKNKDGTVVLEEWASSKTIKPQFERGGVDLSKPLSEDAFIAHFVRLNQQ